MKLEIESISVEEFDTLFRLPEYRNCNLEYIGGYVYDTLTSPFCSMLGARMVGFIGIFLTSHNIGHMTGANGGYMVSGERYIPDVGFISYEKQPSLDYFDGYIQNAPDLAVEVLSPGNEDEDMAIKIANYLAAKTLVWLLKPLQQQVVVFRSGQPAKVLGIDGTLDGEDVLPGFSLKVADIFAQKQPE